MVTTEKITLPEIAVIGKAGLCTMDNNIVSDLWAQATAGFDEIAPVGMKEADGSFAGFWGVMSDVSMAFRPWEDGYTRGMYLAGIEVYKDTPVPEGWEKWVMPARTYLVADVTGETYGAVFSEVINEVIPSMNLQLSGAVCDYTKPATGQNKLFFPVTGNN